MLSKSELIEIALDNGLEPQEARSLVLSYYVDIFGSMDIETLSKLAGLVIISCLILETIKKT